MWVFSNPLTSTVASIWNHLLSVEFYINRLMKCTKFYDFIQITFYCTFVIFSKISLDCLLDSHKPWEEYSFVHRPPSPNINNRASAAAQAASRRAPPPPQATSRSNPSRPAPNVVGRPSPSPTPHQMMQGAASSIGSSIGASMGAAMGQAAVNHATSSGNLPAPLIPSWVATTCRS